MPTRRGVGVLVGAGLCWLAGWVLDVNELYVVTVAAAALVGGAALIVGMGSSEVSVRRRVSVSRAQPDQAIEASIDLRNDGRLPTGTLGVEDACPYALLATSSRGARAELPPLPPGGTRTWSYPIVASSRGRWRIGPLRLVARDPFGVVERARPYSSVSELLVYPRVVPLPVGLRLGAHIGSGRSDRRLLGSGEEFHTIREYRTGDDLRKVHWASTARQQRLMVRQHEQAWAPRATVLLDTRAEAHHGVGQHGSFEAAVTAAASALTRLHQDRYDLKLVTAQPGEPRPRPEPLEHHLERLASVEPGRRQTLEGALRALPSADGMLLALLAPSPTEPAADADVRALLSVGRRFGAKAALVADWSESSPLVTLLASAGWRATTLHGGLPQAWRRLATQPTQRLPA